MKSNSFLLLLILMFCQSCTETEVSQPCRTHPSQLTVKHEFNSIILDGFCDSAEMVKIMDSLLVKRNRSWCHGFRNDSTFELFYSKRKLTKEEDAYLWKNYLGVFHLKKIEPF